MIHFLLVLLVGCSSTSFNRKPLWVSCHDCQLPKSTYYDKGTNLIYVSNIVGHPTEQDGLGWITVMNTKGEVINQKWNTEFNAPKGMRSIGHFLWVTDINQVVAINMKNGKVVRKIPIPQAVYLSDLAITPKGEIYVADPLGSQIFKIFNNRPAIFIEGEHLESPNGLYYKNGSLFVASWGLTKDWSTQTPGRIYELDLELIEMTPITREPLGHLEGLEIDQQGNFFVSDWVAGKIFKVSPQGEVEEYMSGVKGTSDIGLIPHKNILLIPSMRQNQVEAFQL